MLQYFENMVKKVQAHVETFRAEYILSNITRYFTRYVYRAFVARSRTLNTIYQRYTSENLVSYSSWIR